MARTALTRLPMTRAGAELVFTAVDATASPNGNYYPSDGTELVVIKNGDASPHTLTVAVNPASAPDGLPVSGRAITIPASKTFYAGPFGSQYRQADGSVYLNWDAATSMTVAVIDLPS